MKKAIILRENKSYEIIKDNKSKKFYQDVEDIFIKNNIKIIYKDHVLDTDKANYLFTFEGRKINGDYDKIFIVGNKKDVGNKYYLHNTKDKFYERSSIVNLRQHWIFTKNMKEKLDKILLKNRNV